MAGEELMTAAVPLEGGAWPALRLEVRACLRHNLFATVCIRCVLDGKVDGQACTEGIHACFGAAALC